MGIAGALIVNVWYLRMLKKQNDSKLFLQLFSRIISCQDQLFERRINPATDTMSKKQFKAEHDRLKIKMPGYAEAFCFLINKGLFSNKRMLHDYIKYSLKEWYQWANGVNKKFPDQTGKSGLILKSSRCINLYIVQQDLKDVTPR